MRNYIEPFFGSGAVLLGRPHEPHIETANDLDGFVCNFWRAVQTDPDAVAHYADYPGNECDLHARHAWLTQRRGELAERLEGDPDFYDAKIAGWWVWGMAIWIGGEFCSGNGPWHVVDGKLVHLGNDGRGVTRKRIHATDRGITRRRVYLGTAGMGVTRRHICLREIGIRGSRGRGDCGLVEWMRALANRLRRVRVCCGDWKRVCDSNATLLHPGVPCGVFLDPPYGESAQRDRVYSIDSMTVADEVREWCIKWGENRDVRIALCGYVGEHEMLAEHGWTPHRWTAHGGYANVGNGRGKQNREREVIWFSPHCLPRAR